MTRGEDFSAGAPYTLDNFARIASPLYLRSLLQSLRLAFFTALFCLLLGYPFAYFMAKASARARTWIMLLLIVPFWTNALIRIYGWKILFAANGPINATLMAIGLISRPLKLLYTEFAVQVGMVYAMIPFMVLPVYSAVERMDWAMVEASRDLGASPARAFFTVTLPMTLPGVLAPWCSPIPPSGCSSCRTSWAAPIPCSGATWCTTRLLKSRDLPFAAALSVACWADGDGDPDLPSCMGGRAENMVFDRSSPEGHEKNSAWA